VAVILPKADTEGENRVPRRLWLLIVAALLALGIAFLGAYLVVVSQNPGNSVSGQPTDYGPIQ
jgi:hypothetical protein